MKHAAALALCLLSVDVHAGSEASHQPYRAGLNQSPQPVQAGRTARPMRYQPKSGGFVITNGTERFNRPLYIGYGGARLDAGDRPEFAFYLPGKGGVLRLGLVADGKAKWLLNADTVVAKYREGRMAYEIFDPLLGDGMLGIEAVPASGRTGALIKATLESGEDIDLVWAYGGATGKVDFRGDIGYMDVAKKYGLQKEDCSDSCVDLGKDRFVLRSEDTVVSGLLSCGSEMQAADAGEWDNLSALLDSTDGGHPVALGRVPLGRNNPFYLMLAKGEIHSSDRGDLASSFEQSVAAKRAISRQVAVETPDPYINAMMPALNIAADALWDGVGYTHGDVAWRRRLFGWRTSYTGDALGWTDRTQSHLRWSFACQRVQPENDTFISSGYLYADNSRIYNMDLVVADVLMRHLRRTGDLKFARELWPSIERLLAHEKRLFDRDGLYDARPSIWSSDALQYNGGGAAHTTAYNFFLNKMAAEIARLIGENATPYEAETQRIAKAIQSSLWLKDEGVYAEFRDLQGEQQAHPAAALWSVYHMIDSEVPDNFQAWQLGRYIETRIPRIPVHGPGVPEGDWAVVPTTTWMPYLWSINNVAAGEIYHTALACWQTGRSHQAWQLFMGTVLENMYRGICPGNVGMTLSLDAHRGEAIRDFGFIGIMSRAVVEGLFGVDPNMLAGELTLRPGWPEEWTHVSFRHPSIEYSFNREGGQDRYRIKSAFGCPVRLKLVVPVRGESLKVAVAGDSVVIKNINDSVGHPRALIELDDVGSETELVLNWSGEKPPVAADGSTSPDAAPSAFPKVVACGEYVAFSSGRANVLGIKDPQGALEQLHSFGRGFMAKVSSAPGNFTVFARVEDGGWSWWMPVEFEARPALEIVTGYDGRETPKNESGALRFRVRNNTRGRLKADAVMTIDAHQQVVPVDLFPGEESEEIRLFVDGLLPGSHSVRVEAAGRFGQGQVVNWGIQAGTGRFKTLDLTSAFNARVDEIFKTGKYIMAGRPKVTLGVPDSGYGEWCIPTMWDEYKAAGGINASGLRNKAASQNGKLRLKSGVPFRVQTRDDAANIAFVSRWNAHPNEVVVSLKGHARHLYLLMAGSTYHMQSRFENGVVEVEYADGSIERMSLRNPENWWPIDRDYFIDDYAFRLKAPRPPRIRLDSGEEYFGETRYAAPGVAHVPSHLILGGAATVLDLPLDSQRQLKSLKIRAVANESIIGLMAATLAE